MEMPVLRRDVEPRSPPQRISQPLRAGYRAEPDYTLQCLPQPCARSPNLHGLLINLRMPQGIVLARAFASHGEPLYLFTRLKTLPTPEELPALLTAGDLDGAISQFRSAIKLAPDYAPAHLHLAEALQRKGEKEEAKQEFQRAAQLDPRLQTSTPQRLMNRCAALRCSIPPELPSSPSRATQPRTASSLLSVKHSDGPTSLSKNSRCI